MLFFAMNGNKKKARKTLAIVVSKAQTVFIIYEEFRQYWLTIEWEIKLKKRKELLFKKFNDPSLPMSDAIAVVPHLQVFQFFLSDISAEEIPHEWIMIKYSYAPDDDICQNVDKLLLLLFFRRCLRIDIFSGVMFHMRGMKNKVLMEVLWMAVMRKNSFNF